MLISVAIVDVDNDDHRAATTISGSQTSSHINKHRVRHAEETQAHNDRNEARGRDEIEEGERASERERAKERKIERGAKKQRI